MIVTFTGNVETAKTVITKNFAWCDIKHMSSWSNEEITDFYDANPDITIEQYSRNLCISELELKNILLK